ncbi:MAG: CAP domain-containing protein [Patescibacteria group bacterium]
MLEKIKKILPFIIVALILIKITASVALYFYPKVISHDNIAVKSDEIIHLTNNYRQQNGLSVLQMNPRLTQAAVNKAKDLIAGQYFDHTSPQGKLFSDWIKEVDYKYFYVGENLAIDFTSSTAVFNAWLNSSKHKENLVKPQYEEIGVAVIKGKFKNRPTLVVVQLFGTRVLGQFESVSGDSDALASSSPVSSTANYFYYRTFWDKISSLEDVAGVDYWLNYILLIISCFCLIIYRPLAKSSQTNIKPPTANRYQAKTFKE